MHEDQTELLSKRIALPIFGSNALSSLAYAPDQILLTLALAGMVAASSSVLVGLVVAAVLIVVVLSYRQILRAFPQGGGDYAVVKENMGANWGFVVASAALIDAVLTVAVSVSAATAYMTAAIPALGNFRLLLVGGLVLILWGSVARGSGRIRRGRALPAYAFIVATFVLILAGSFQWFAGTLAQAPAADHTLIASDTYSTGAIGIAGGFILLRAFSAGCVALTGIERMTYGTSMFRRPQARNASIALVFLGIMVAVLLIALMMLSKATGIQAAQTYGQDASGYITTSPVLSQLASIVFGEHSAIYYLIAIATVGVLLSAARLTFTGFPALTAAVSRDSFLPRQLRTRGQSQSFSRSNIALAAASIGLALAFNADVSRLIYLYIVGVFVTFTLSQLSMIRYWNTKLRSIQTGIERTRCIQSRAINIVGFIATVVVLAVVLLSHFIYGAWIALALIAGVFAIGTFIRRHYDSVAQELRIVEWDSTKANPSSVHAIVLLSSFTRPTQRAIRVARASGATTIDLVCAAESVEEEDRIRSQWEMSQLNIPLTFISSPLRRTIPAITSYIRQVRRAAPTEMLVIYLPQFLLRHWWEKVFHNHTAAILHRELLRIPGVVVTSVPWALGTDDDIDGGPTHADPYHSQAPRTPDHTESARQ